ncbi:CAF17-like 4Fe-4S cluster assembly/insertion protein YgfZ [Thiolapillus sp.]
MNRNEFLQQTAMDEHPDQEDCVLCALASRGLIRVSGEDARDFLQGQLTNDINAVTAEQAQLSAWCNPKGRMLALFLVFMHDGDLYLQLPRERLDAVLKRLRMFVLRARVVLEDVSDDLVIAGAAGACLEETITRLPGKDLGAVTSDDLTLIRLPGEQPRIQVVGTADAVNAFRQRMANRAATASEDWWTLQNIRAGLPEVLDATAEAFIPQMVNLDVLEGISFTKGCYTGQEVVARMKYLGQLKRRMYLARATGNSPMSPGDSLWSPHSQSAQGAGKVVLAARLPDGSQEALAVAEISVAGAGGIRLHDGQGPEITLDAPPYEIPELQE